MHFIDSHQKYWIYISVMRGSKVLKNPITWQRLTIDQKRISRLFLSIRVIANIWLLQQIITSVLLPPPTYFKIGVLEFAQLGSILLNFTRLCLILLNFTQLWFTCVLSSLRHRSWALFNKNDPINSPFILLNRIEL